MTTEHQPPDRQPAEGAAVTGAGPGQTEPQDAGGSAPTPPPGEGGASSLPPAQPSGEGGTGAPPPGPPPGAPGPRLARSDSDRVIAGVAGGLGAYLGADARLLRIVFVVLTLFGGVGLLLYAVGWLCLPSERAARPPLEVGLGQLRAAPLWLQVLLIVLAGLALARGIRLSGPLIVLALVLIALGYALFRQDTGAALGESGPAGAAAPGGYPPPLGGGPAAPAPPGGLQAPAPGAPGAPGAPAATTSATWPAGTGLAVPPPPPRPRSVLGQATVAVALVTLGVVALLDTTGTLDVSVRDGLALVLAVLGFGLVVGAWRGRARWLIAVGLLLLPVLVAATLLRVPVSGGIGERVDAPQTVAEVQDEYEVGIGSLRLDLSAVRMDEATVDVHCRVGIGELEVLVPPGAAVEVHGALRGGTVELFGGRREARGGWDSGEFVAFERGSPGGGLLRLDLEANYGRIAVRRG
jgi:phage shock protein PspC (stress-responsive transcriptional regulator)